MEKPNFDKNRVKLNCKVGSLLIPPQAGYTMNQTINKKNSKGRDYPNQISISGIGAEDRVMRLLTKIVSNDVDLAKYYQTDIGSCIQTH